MQFNIDDNMMLSDFFNMLPKKTQILNPKEGLILGNMFIETYKPYKNYKPCEYTACTEQEKLMLRIQELSFALNDLNLYLDINPNDTDCFNLFKTYAQELNRCKEKYENEYNVINLNDDVNNCYSWYKNPWPWEGKQNV